MRLQRQYLPNNTSVINTIQTNGLLLNSEWARLIKAHNIGLCLSLDGPPEINDQWRRTKSGRGTHHLVLRGIEVLRREDIPLSILSVITPEALPHGVSIYGALRELGGGWMDFMYPFYSRIDNTLDESIEPVRWGHFLVDVFDAWMAEGNPDVEIRMLHDICMSILRGRTKMCISCADCSYVLTINPNGDAYICDDLLAYADSWLGNIHEAALMSCQRTPGSCGWQTRTCCSVRRAKPVISSRCAWEDALCSAHRRRTISTAGISIARLRRSSSHTSPSSSEGL